MDKHREPCPLCGKPLGPLDRWEKVNGQRRHVQPCPTSARPTGKRAFDYLPPFPPSR